MQPPVIASPLKRYFIRRIKLLNTGGDAPFTKYQKINEILVSLDMQSFTRE